LLVVVKLCNEEAVRACLAYVKQCDTSLYCSSSLILSYTRNGFVFAMFNLLQTNPGLLYLKTHFIPRSKHFSFRL